MSSEDVTLRLRMIDEFSATTGNLKSELKAIEQAAGTSASSMGASFETVATSTTGAYSTIASSAEKIKTNWKAVVAAIAAAGAAIQTTVAAIERFAGYAEVKEQLNQLSAQFGTTGDSIIADIKRISEGRIGIEEATQATLAGLKNKLDPGQVKELAAAAVAFNTAAGVSAAEAFERLMKGVAAGNARAVASIIGKEGVTEALKGLSGNSEKVAALMKVINDRTVEHQNLTKNSVQTLSNSIEKTKKDWQDFTLKMSGYAASGAYAVAAIFNAVAASLSRVAAGAVAAYAGLQTLSLNFSGAKESWQTAKDLYGSANELSKQASDYMAMAKRVGEADKLIEKQKKETAAAIKAQADAEDELSTSMATSSGGASTSEKPSSRPSGGNAGSSVKELRDIAKSAEEAKELLREPSETARVNFRNLDQIERHTFGINATATKSANTLDQIDGSVNAIKGNTAEIINFTSAAASSLAAILDLQKQNSLAGGELGELKIHTRYLSEIYLLVGKIYTKMTSSSSSGSGSTPQIPESGTPRSASTTTVRSSIGVSKSSGSGSTVIHIHGVVGDEREVARKVNKSLDQAKRYREVA